MSKRADVRVSHGRRAECDGVLRGGGLRIWFCGLSTVLTDQATDRVDIHNLVVPPVDRTERHWGVLHGPTGIFVPIVSAAVPKIFAMGYNDSGPSWARRAGHPLSWF
ncbi:hypothetical protein GCM10009798_35310 [Nocardioides panacihumi]|uniref:Uncharacterized protein n=1 Tax=Nocardioides panacihumi TaxID=400774 RepID=A0ABN2RMK4_9ACTN